MRTEIALKIIDHNKKVYDLITKEFSQTRDKSWPEFEYFKGYLKDGQAVLDLGCGNGRLLKILEDFKIDYLGIDNSSNLIKDAKQKWPEYNFKEADILDLSLLEKKYDLVFMVSALHHIPSKKFREQVINNIRKHLKADGKLLMINWNLWQKRYLKYIIKYTLLKLTEPSKEIKEIEGLKINDLDFQDVFIPFFDKKNIRYMHAFTENNIINLLEKNGFEIIKNVSNTRNIITTAKLK